MRWSPPQEASCWLSRLNATQSTADAWPVSVRSSYVSAFHSLTVWSPLPEAMCLPSRLQATLPTTAWWPGIDFQFRYPLPYPKS